MVSWVWSRKWRVSSGGGVFVADSDFSERGKGIVVLE